MKLKSPTEEPISVTLLSGHGIRIGPDGRDVPEMFRKAAFAQGAIPINADKSDFEGPGDKQIDESQLALLITGVKKMLVENPKDFTGAGLPNRKVLSNIVGWNVSVQELSVAWAKIQDESKDSE
jgi:hypothetical protein